MKAFRVQRLLLETLASSQDTRLGRGQHYLAEAVRDRAPADARPDRRALMEAVWSLVSQGLAYIDFSQPAAENWCLELTDAGRAAVLDQGVTPDDPSGYLDYLHRIPHISPLVLAYATEALHAYRHQLYRASAILIGVASEALVFDAANAFSVTMAEPERTQYLQTIGSKKQSTLAKFAAFRDKMRSNTRALPGDLIEGLDLTVHAVADLLRLSRNAAGHPTGTSISREESFTFLQLFARYAQKLTHLRSHFGALSG